MGHVAEEDGAYQPGLRTSLQGVCDCMTAAAIQWALRYIVGTCPSMIDSDSNPHIWGLRLSAPPHIGGVTFFALQLTFAKPIVSVCFALVEARYNSRYIEDRKPSKPEAESARCGSRKPLAPGS